MTTTINLGEWIASARLRLRSVSQQPGLESLVLASAVLGRNRTWVEAHPEFDLEPDIVRQLDQLIERLALREPLPYILGRQEFYGLDFVVTPDVLIPRPETELLVETALEWLAQNPSARMAVDVGSGSGCIAVVLAKQAKDLQVLAVDISRPALRITRRNCQNHQVENRVQLIQSDLLSALWGEVDLICANLPYIPDWKLPALDVSRHEPILALDGGPDGFDLIRKLLGQISPRLSPGGLALFEIEAGQGETARTLARSITGFSDVAVQEDLAGYPRLLRMRKPDERRSSETHFNAL